MKRQLRGLIVVLLVCISVVYPIQAAESASILNTFQISYSPENMTKFVIEDKQLRIEGLPKSDDFKYIWIQVMDQVGNQKLKNISQKAEINLKSLKEGTYNIEVLKNKERYGQYSGYVWGTQVQIKVSPNDISFVTSPIYEHNKKMFATEVIPESYLGLALWIDPTNEDIIGLAKEITKGLDDDYSKVIAIAEWVADNIYYDFDALEGRDLVAVQSTSVYKRKRTICEGYSSLTAALLRSLGIPTKIIYGFGLGGVDTTFTPEVINSNEINHAWNEAYVDGRWVILDTTFTSPHTYINGTFNQGGDLEKRFLDPSIESFSATHKIVEIRNY